MRQCHSNGDGFQSAMWIESLCVAMGLGTGIDTKRLSPIAQPFDLDAREYHQVLTLQSELVLVHFIVALAAVLVLMFTVVVLWTMGDESH